MDVPAPGFHFLPTEEELIECYLLPRSQGLPIDPVSELVEKDLYGDRADPWVVLSDVPWEETSVSQGEKNGIKTVNSCIYVITKLIMASKNRFARKAGSGTWKNQSIEQIKNNEGEVIGLDTALTFSHDSNRDEHYTMHQFSLDGVSLKKGLKEKNLALCRIHETEKIDVTKNWRRSAGTKRSMVEDEVVTENKRAKLSMPSPQVKEIVIDSGDDVDNVVTEPNLLPDEETATEVPEQVEKAKLSMPSPQVEEIGIDSEVDIYDVVMDELNLLPDEETATEVPEQVEKAKLSKLSPQVEEIGIDSEVDIYDVVMDELNLLPDEAAATAVPEQVVVPDQFVEEELSVSADGSSTSLEEWRYQQSTSEEATVVADDIYFDLDELFGAGGDMFNHQQVNALDAYAFI